jgi:hypothetical protein
MQLTDYGPQPTQAVLIYSNVKPSASTNEAAMAITASETSSATSAGATSSNATSSTAHDSGLSVGAKAGIGAGVGGGVLAIAMIVVTVLLCRKRRSKPETTQQSQSQSQSQNQNQNQYPYPIGAPMPNSPYFAQAEKDSWHAAAYSAGSSPPMMSPPVMSPQFDPALHGHYTHIIPSIYSEQQSQKPASISPPTELSAEQRVHELHSEQLTTNSEAGNAPGDKK